MKISIIIVNYQSRVYLEKCLNSVFLKINTPFELIVVNNGLEDELRGLNNSFPAIKVIQNFENNGFGGANNLGAKEAQGELLFFLNPDTEIISEEISLVVAEFDKNPNLGILGSKIMTPEGAVQRWTVGARINLLSVLKNNLKIITDKQYWQSLEKKSVFWVAGTALFIRRELFLRIGGFDSQFFMYFEDVDLCNRVQLSGKTVLYFPSFSVLHHGGKSFSGKEWQKKQYYKAQDQYFRKNLGFFQASCLSVLRFLFFALKHR